jgi:hypothetical protein
MIVDTVFDGPTAEGGRLLSDETTEFGGSLDDAGVGVAVAAEESEPASSGKFVSSVGVALAVASSGLTVLDTATPVLLAGLGVGRLLGKVSALSPAQSAEPPSFTTIPTPAIASPNPFLSWNCLISKASLSPGSCRFVISFLPGFIYIKKLYCRSSPFSSKEPGAM